jgi:hypothetical protein
MKNKLLRCLALVLSGVFFNSGCATPPHSYSEAWGYKTIQRLDYPGLNKDNDFSSVYAFPWKTQLSLYEQQGWSVDSVSVSERKLAGGQTMQSAIIVLKRAKKQPRFASALSRIF